MTAQDEPGTDREVTCFNCGRYWAESKCEAIDVSTEDEYYPVIRHVCLSCQRKA